MKGVTVSSVTRLLADTPKPAGTVTAVSIPSTSIAAEDGVSDTAVEVSTSILVSVTLAVDAVVWTGSLDMLLSSDAAVLAPVLVSDDGAP